MLIFLQFFILAAFCLKSLLGQYATWNIPITQGTSCVSTNYTDGVMMNCTNLGFSTGDPISHDVVTTMYVTMLKAGPVSAIGLGERYDYNDAWCKISDYPAAGTTWATKSITQYSNCYYNMVTMYTSTSTPYSTIKPNQPMVVGKTYKWTFKPQSGTTGIKCYEINITMPYPDGTFTPLNESPNGICSSSKSYQYGSRIMVAPYVELEGAGQSTFYVQKSLCSNISDCISCPNGNTCQICRYGYQVMDCGTCTNSTNLTCPIVTPPVTNTTNSTNSTGSTNSTNNSTGSTNSTNNSTGSTNSTNNSTGSTNSTNNSTGSTNSTNNSTGSTNSTNNSTGGTNSTEGTNSTNSTGGTGGTNSTNSTGGTNSTNSTGGTGGTNSTNSTGDTNTTNPSNSTGGTNSTNSTGGTGGTNSTNSTGGTNSTNSTGGTGGTNSTNNSTGGTNSTNNSTGGTNSTNNSTGGSNTTEPSNPSNNSTNNSTGGSNTTEPSNPSNNSTGGTNSTNSTGGSNTTEPSNPSNNSTNNSTGGTNSTNNSTGGSNTTEPSNPSNNSTNNSTGGSNTTEPSNPSNNSTGGTNSTNNSTGGTNTTNPSTNSTNNSTGGSNTTNPDGGTKTNDTQQVSPGKTETVSASTEPSQDYASRIIILVLVVIGITALMVSLLFCKKFLKTFAKRRGIRKGSKSIKVHPSPSSVSSLYPSLDLDARKNTPKGGTTTSMGLIKEDESESIFDLTKRTRTPKSRFHNINPTLDQIKEDVSVFVLN